MIRENIDLILGEIRQVLSSISEEQTGQLIDEILKTVLRRKKIVVAGAGKVGMAMRAFGMRLGHLGFEAYTLGDSVVPSIGKGDLFLVSSGSGETQTIYDVVEIAHKNGARVVLVTGNPDSRMGRLAHTVVKISAPSKTKAVEGLVSSQPMTTLNEQCLMLFFDAVVLALMAKTDQTHDDMWARHSNLE